MSDHTTAATEVEQEPKAAPEQAGSASLDKVRDILFGAHIREFERRLLRLEDQLLKETAELKEDVRKRLMDLERFMHQETEALATRLQTERDERSDQTADLSRTLRDATQTAERKTATLEDQLARAQRDLRQQILAQQQRISDEIRESAGELTARVNQEAQELRNSKADRAALAALFTELAMRLNNELTIPGLEEAGNG